MLRLIHPRPALAVLPFLLALAGPAPLAAQCPDGSPPPCEVAPRRAVPRRAPPGAAERGRAFLVLPFRNVTAAPEYQWLVEGSPTLLSDALGQWQELKVVPEERLYPALRRHGLVPGAVVPEDRLRPLAEETGGWTVVTGEVLATGQRIRVTARAMDVITRRVVVRAAEEAGTQDDIRGAYTRLAGRLLEAAGMEPGAADLPGATTRSLDAYKAYLRGVAAYNRGELVRAREALTEAVTLDTGFAQAYAKLADASMASLQDLIDPNSPAYRHVERAVALSSRLPRRDRDFVLAANAVFRGQLGYARETFNRLVAEDSTDLESLQGLAELEGFDPILVPVPGGERPRGSRNRSVRLAKLILERDATRYQSYSTLTQVYAVAGGWVNGRAIGFRTEAPSLGAMMSSVPTRVFTVILRDSLELIPAESLSTIPPDTLRRARERAQDVAMAWVRRWLTAQPRSWQAHLMASQVHEIAGRFDAALAEQDTAVAIGVEFEGENLAGRRMMLLAKQRRFDAAARAADSLTDAAYFRNTLASGFLINHAAWAAHVYFVTGRSSRAEDLLEQLQGLFAASGIDSARAGASAMCVVLCVPRSQAQLVLVDMADSTRLEALDSAFGRLEMFAPNRIVARYLTIWASGMPAGHRPRVVAAARRALDRVERAKRTDLMVELVRITTNADTSVDSRRDGLTRLMRVTTSDSSDRRAFYWIGRIAGDIGEQLDVAERALRRYLAQPALPQAPSHAAAHWRLGVIAERRGNRAAARAAFEEAARLDPADPEFRAALERIRRN
jgi:tetratricopeptide (TPR) repeat protein